MMRREWNLRMRGCVLLLSVFLLVTAGCTLKKEITSAEEETSNMESVSISSEEEEGLYENWKKKSDTGESEQEIEIEENEIPDDITESEAKDRVLADVMRISGAEDPEVDQTSVKIVGENKDAYLVSIDIYEKEAGSNNESGNPSGSQVTELYRVDRKTGEVNYLPSENDFR